MASYYLPRGIAAYNQGYSWDEMDWNCDGGTTIGELLESGDIGRRAVSDSTKRCIEYYTYKDTVPLRLDYD